MSDKKPNPTEKLLRELADAERVRLFDRTTVDVQGVLRDAPVHPPLPAIFRFRVVAPLAAACIVAMFVWGAMFRAELNSLQNGKNANALIANAGQQVHQLSACLSGPGSSVDGACRKSDLDSDGMVSLRDVQTLQLAYAGS